MDFSIFESEFFILGYYVLTVGVSLLLVKDTKKRILGLASGVSSIKYASLSFGIIIAYAFFGFEFLESIPFLNWGWLGYNIAYGPFAEQGIWGIIPFVPILIYMFIHLNYIEEFYFRKSKKMVVVWALMHIAMGIKVHTALILLPIGFLFKYVYDKKGLEHSYAMHFTTNILVVLSLFLSFFF